MNTFHAVLRKPYKNNNDIERKYLMNFLRIILNENITEKEHDWKAGMKMVKNIGSLCKAKHLFNKLFIKNVSFIYIPESHKLT